jgi:hypothetical protein
MSSVIQEPVAAAYRRSYAKQATVATLSLATPSGCATNKRSVSQKKWERAEHANRFFVRLCDQ